MLVPNGARETGEEVAALDRFHCITECAFTGFNGIIRGLNSVNIEAINIYMRLLYIKVTDRVAAQPNRGLLVQGKYKEY